MGPTEHAASAADRGTARAIAADSLRGLALGDGFGECWFPRITPDHAVMIRERRLPIGRRWVWTDDTAMALGIMRVLMERGEIDPALLAATFAEMHHTDPDRGYGYGMTELLPRLRLDPTAWDVLARDLFGGEGSLGNGAAMRAAPLGAWFCAEAAGADGTSTGADAETRGLGYVAEQARRSAMVTHAHPQGIAGAAAVAVAAALAGAGRGATAAAAGEFLRRIAEHTPPGPVRAGLITAADLDPAASVAQAVEALGNGSGIRAEDTVPFALWSAARHLDSLTDALWCTAEGGGDVDTTCAIVGGVVAARTGLGGVPTQWLRQCEPLPQWTQDV